MAARMEELAQQQPGFLGMKSARDGVGITVSYWASLEAIVQWKQHAEHLAAQALGHQQWTTHFRVRIAKVEREYGLPMKASKEIEPCAKVFGKDNSVCSHQTNKSAH